MLTLAKEEEWAPVLDTPCVNVCLLDTEFGVCIGCGRTLEEIAGWASMTDRERRAIMALLPARLESLEKSESKTA
jgi:predicted Fe-S protein YdhL (DUF1289 family)